MFLSILIHFKISRLQIYLVLVHNMKTYLACRFQVETHRNFSRSFAIDWLKFYVDTPRVMLSKQFDSRKALDIVLITECFVFIARDTKEFYFRVFFSCGFR